ncbi:MAG TPA: M15 family metallopeptidase [Galbitalea sp.]|nr:M15 family metallopeptidase [Galbitalea sp.]
MLPIAGLAVVVALSATACAPVRSAIANNTTIPHPTQSAASTPSSTPTPTPTGFNKQQYSLDSASSLWVVVNKLRPLNPITFAPPLVNVTVPHVYGYQMQAPAAAALAQMFAAAKAAGAGNMEAQSSYRSYSAQASDHAALVSRDGLKVADNESARAGYSEHQTGLAVDIAPVPADGCNLEICFGTMAQGKWLAANAYKFGYLLRYPADKVAVTGYQYEPWHFRYIGIPLATEMHNEGVQTMEEFFGLPAAPDYAP